MIRGYDVGKLIDDIALEAASLLLRNSSLPGPCNLQFACKKAELDEDLAVLSVFVFIEHIQRIEHTPHGTHTAGYRTLHLDEGHTQVPVVVVRRLVARSK